MKMSDVPDDHNIEDIDLEFLNTNLIQCNSFSNPQQQSLIIK